VWVCVCVGVGVGVYVRERKGGGRKECRERENGILNEESLKSRKDNVSQKYLLKEEYSTEIFT